MTLIGSGGIGVALQLDRKIVVVGNAGSDILLARYNPNGTLDTTFGCASAPCSGAITTNIGSFNHGLAVVVQSDGKLVVAGYIFSSFATRNDLTLVRYNPNGTLDESFGSGGIVITPLSPFDDGANALGLQSDGKLVVAGFTNPTLSGSTQFAVARYDASGALDTTFGCETPPCSGTVSTSVGSSGVGVALAIRSDGKLVVAGNADGDLVVLRYNSNGTLDGSFGTAGVVTEDLGSIYDVMGGIAIQDDTKIVVAGSDGSRYDFVLLRYDDSGALDSSFGSAGKSVIPFAPYSYGVRDVAIQPDGKIVVAGGGKDTLLARVWPNGALDMSFGVEGKVRTTLSSFDEHASALALQSDGKIVTVGNVSDGSQSQISILRYLGADAIGRLDFDADGLADILWRNTSSGEDYIFFMNGAAVAAGSNYTNAVPDLGWQIVGAGDFDGDGRADILWRNAATGDDYIFLMDGTTVKASSGYTNMVGAPWTVAGVGDFDGDGKADILWRNASSGEDYIFFMDGVAVKAGSNYTNAVPDQDWQVAGVADFDGDGKADILWRNGATGEDYVFLMSGTAVLGTSGYTNTVGGPWTVAGVGDFDGDGVADILWRNGTTGEDFIFLMNATTVLGTSGYTNSVPELAWDVVGTGDYDGDGRSDILWRHATSGENYVFLMNGTAVQPGSTYTNAVPDLSWQVQNP